VPRAFADTATVLPAFALLAVTQLGDRAMIERMIDDAAADLAPAPTPERR
jgi:hypothetical protein